MARTTERSEVVSMVATCGYPLAVLALRKYRVEKEVLGYFLTSGKCTPMSGASEWEYISPCLLRFEFCKKPVGRTYQRSWYISAHFVKAVKGKMLVVDCQKARMKSRVGWRFFLDRTEWQIQKKYYPTLTEWSDPHYP